MNVTGHLMERLGWENIGMCIILKLLLLLQVQLPILCQYSPESGIREGSSLSKNWPKIPRHANKTSIEDNWDAHSRFVIILSERSAQVNSMEGRAK